MKNTIDLVSAAYKGWISQEVLYNELMYNVPELYEYLLDTELLSNPDVNHVLNTLNKKFNKYEIPFTVKNVKIIDGYDPNKHDIEYEFKIVKNINELKIRKYIREEIKKALKEREIKSGFKFVNLAKGDIIKNKKNNKMYIVISVGSDSAYIKDKLGNNQLEILSLSDYEPIQIKSME